MYFPRPEIDRIFEVDIFQRKFSTEHSNYIENSDKRQIKLKLMLIWKDGKIGIQCVHPYV